MVSGWCNKISDGERERERDVEGFNVCTRPAPSTIMMNGSMFLCMPVHVPVVVWDVEGFNVCTRLAPQNLCNIALI